MHAQSLPPHSPHPNHHPNPFFLANPLPLPLSHHPTPNPSPLYHSIYPSPSVPLLTHPLPSPIPPFPLGAHGGRARLPRPFPGRARRGRAHWAPMGSHWGPMGLMGKPFGTQWGANGVPWGPMHGAHYINKLPIHRPSGPYVNNILALLQTPGPDARTGWPCARNGFMYSECVAS